MSRMKHRSTEIYTLSLHDALPILAVGGMVEVRLVAVRWRSTAYVLSLGVLLPRCLVFSSPAGLGGAVLHPTH